MTGGGGVTGGGPSPGAPESGVHVSPLFDSRPGCTHRNSLETQCGRGSLGCQIMAQFVDGLHSF